MTSMDRRGFLKTGSIATVATYFSGSTQTHLMATPQPEPAKPIAPNDTIQIALIGAGGQGQGDTRIAASIPGVKVVAAADCYNGCLDHAKELWGNDIFTTRDYQEILARKDIDAVIIGTPDHWHMQASVDAMNAGKDVYCEKPMIHVYSDGPKIIDTWRKTGRIMQVGSQRVSSIVYKQAKHLLESRAIGKITVINAWWDLAMVAGFMALYIVQTALSLPGAAILSLAAGAIFGVFMGTVCAIVAATIGATLAFLLARYVFRDAVLNRFGSKLEGINRELDERGFNYLLFLRLVPLFPFFLINLAAGLTRLPLRTFFIGTLLGIIPGGFVYVNAGASLATIDSLSGIASPRVLGSFALLGLFALLPVLYNRFKSRKLPSAKF